MRETRESQRQSSHAVQVLEAMRTAGEARGAKETGDWGWTRSGSCRVRTRRNPAPASVQDFLSHHGSAVIN